MVYVLIALLIGLAWALWFILQLALWIPLVASAALVFLALVVALVTLLSARRAAGGLERALAEQGQQQVMNARPEKRAEIQALQKQISDGIAALKSSRLGGKARGGSALYALPWYAIIGPPGAGKTTALRHSGLVFPYADSAVRGVGGTRNCDWWFTNEAILLDTAGRYATEQEDQGEWLAFLDMLRKYRKNKPLNGLIVAVGVADIIDANEAQLEHMAKTLRARIDEVMTRLRMNLPVYFLVTKCDLVAGFVEFFGGLKRSERAQPWGATIPLNEDKSNPGAIFAREFDALVQAVHARTAKRMVEERDFRAREAIYQFPLEFVGIKRNLHELVAQVFAPNSFQGTPTFRGFYFSSGTQEGAPLNRVLERMGHAMGIRPQQLGIQPRVEPKSYFLHDVFMRVAFPDADVAARSASEVRRQRLTRIAVGIAALAVALTLTVPATLSYFNNQALLVDAERTAKKAARIDWEDSQPISDKLDQLDPLLAQLKALEAHERDGVPFGLRFLMYNGDAVYRPLIRVYVANMQLGFVRQCKFSLEGKLRGMKVEDYFADRLLLKQYLMLSEVEHLDVDWATGQLVGQWAALEARSSSVARIDLEKRMEPHVRYYLELIKPIDGKPRAAAVPANDKLVAAARKALAAVDANKRLYALFVDALEHERWDPSGEPEVGNLQFPPVTLELLFTDRPDALRWMGSKQHHDQKKWLEVRGPYTEWGHIAVLANIAHAERLLLDDAWVVPLTKEDTGERLASNLKRLAEDYEQRYIASWEALIADVEVKVPASLREAADLYEEMQKPERPHLKLLRALEDHTQFPRDLKQLESEQLEKMGERKVEGYLRRRLGGIAIDVDPQKISGRTSRVPSHFAATVAFGVPKKGATLNETGLSTYFDDLDKLRTRIRDALQDQPEAPSSIVATDLRAMNAQLAALLLQTDDLGRRLLTPLVTRPLDIGGTSYR